MCLRLHMYPSIGMKCLSVVMIQRVEQSGEDIRLAQVMESLRRNRIGLKGRRVC